MKWIEVFVIGSLLACLGFVLVTGSWKKYHKPIEAQDNFAEKIAMMNEEAVKVIEIDLWEKELEEVSQENVYDELIYELEETYEI